MNTAPITTWEGANAYFTLADKPSLLMLVSLLAAAVCAYTVFAMITHEKACARKVGKS